MIQHSNNFHNSMYEGYHAHDGFQKVLKNTAGNMSSLHKHHGTQRAHGESYDSLTNNVRSYIAEIEALDAGMLLNTIGALTIA